MGATPPAAGNLDLAYSDQDTVLVTGATGFVGGRLVPELIDRGHEVRAMTRHPETYDGPGDPSAATSPTRGHSRSRWRASTSPSIRALAGRRRLREEGREAARAFGLAAAACGVRQIVFLGGLGKDSDDLSAHLRSRREVEKLLGESGVPVTVLRAAIVVGAGGISWEMTRQLVEPACDGGPEVGRDPDPADRPRRRGPLPGGRGRPGGRVRTRLRDRRPRAAEYVEMLQQAAEVMKGRSVPILTVPVLTPGLSSHWISFVTDVDTTTGRNLIDSMGTEVIVTDTRSATSCPVSR